MAIYSFWCLLLHSLFCKKYHFKLSKMQQKALLLRLDQLFCQETQLTCSKVKKILHFS
jgi:hypothetical protein